MKEDDHPSSSSSAEAEMISDFLALYSEPGIPRSQINLKVGCVCLLMRNLSVSLGLVKNARVIVRELGRFTILIETILSDADGRSSMKYCGGVNLFSYFCFSLS